MTETDGAWGWIVVTGAFCSHTITFGIVYSFGIIFHSLEENFNGTKTETAWIPSLTTGFLHLAGLLASVLVNKFGCRVVCIIGALACSTGYILSIFAPNIYYLYITLGVVSGCGFGMVFMPTVLIVTQYFNKFRSVACGIALSGCGIGAFIFSPLTKVMLDEYSLKGTLLLLSAIILHCIPCALVFRPLKSGRMKTKQIDRKIKDESYRLLTYTEQNTREIITDRDKDKIGVVGNEIAVYSYQTNIPNNKRAVEMIELRDCELVVRETPDKTEPKDSLDVTYEVQHGDCNMNQDSDSSMSTTARYAALLKRPKMCMVFVSQFHFIFGFYLPFIFIIDKARGLGISETTSAWVVSVIGMSSICGRIVLGCIADNPSVNRLMMFKIFLLLSGISTALIPVLNNIWLMMVYAAIYGVSTGFTISVTSVILLDIVGIEYLTDALGIVSLFSGFGSVLGPPIAGILYDKTGSYTAPFLVSGASLTFSGVLMFLTTFFD